MKLQWKPSLVIFLTILISALFLRAYQFDQYFMYGHDQDLASWIIKDIVQNGHIRLIGQETSNKGVFIGALWYYLLIPFYFLANWDPIGGVWLSILVGTATVASIYFVFTRIWDKNVGLIGSLIYGLSYYTVFTDREVVPTTPAMLWTVWYLYSLHLVLKGNQKHGFMLAALLFGLVWHINLALALVSPILIVVLLISKKKIDIRSLVYGIVVLILSLSPFLAFELRHDFQQTQSILSSLTGSNTHSTEMSFPEKLVRTFTLSAKNINGLFFGDVFSLSERIVFTLFAFIFGVLFYLKRVSKRWLLLFVLWQVLFILFFSVNPINLSEYYINGMNIVWIALVSLFTVFLCSNSKTLPLAVVLIGFFTIANVWRVVQSPVNTSSYVYRRGIVSEIRQDALKNNYPCVSISYITNPGYDLGYRYLFEIENVKTIPVQETVPVYTIVYPHKKEFVPDKTIGAIGLIYPQYSRYNTTTVEENCRGENSNLTDPMFGYTE